MCVFPSGPVVTIPGRNVSFICQLVSVDNTQLQSISWLLNGSALENYRLDNVVTELRSGGNGVLLFTSLSLENNHTTIQCQAIIQSGQTVQSTSEGVLLLQGMRASMPLKSSVLGGGGDFPPKLQINPPPPKLQDPHC